MPTVVEANIGPFYLGTLFQLFLYVQARPHALNNVKAEQCRPAASAFTGSKSSTTTDCSRKTACSSKLLCVLLRLSSCVKRHNTSQCSRARACRIQVAAVFVVGLAHTACSIYTVWFYAIEGYGQPSFIADCVWSFARTFGEPAALPWTRGRHLLTLPSPQLTRFRRPLLPASSSYTMLGGCISCQSGRCTCPP